MKFSRDKYEVLHLGKRNQTHSYRMGNTWLSNTTSKKDLGVVVDHRLNINQHCDVAIKRGKALLGCINRSMV